MHSIDCPQALLSFQHCMSSVEKIKELGDKASQSHTRNLIELGIKAQLASLWIARIMYIN